MSKQQQIQAESTDEYREGFAAARRGLVQKACPYETNGGFSNERMWWFIGWYDANYSRKDEAAA